jgi:CheY-like chemotaxis protein
VDNQYDKSNFRILVADDSKDDARKIQKVLSSGGYKKVKLLSQFDSLNQLDGYDIVVLDIVWPPNCRPQGESSEYFGLVGLRYLRLNSPNTVVILMSGYFFDLNHFDSIVEADGFFKKSIDDSKILEKISRTLQDKREKRLDLLRFIIQDANGQADLLGLDDKTYQQLVKLADPDRQGVQSGQLAETVAKFAPFLTAGNSLFGLVNGILKLLGGV